MSEIHRARQVANLGNDIVSVKDYGAVGDGTTDDTTAIQAALDSGYKHIYFPDDTAYLCGALTISSDEMIVFGKAQLNLADNTNDSMFTVSGQRVIIDGLRMFGNKSNQSATSNAVKITASNVKIKNVKMGTFYSNGIYSANNYGTVVRSNVFYDCYDYAILIENDTPSTVGGGHLIEGNEIVINSGLVGDTNGGIKVTGDGYAQNGFMNRSRISNNKVQLPASPTDTTAACIEITGLGRYSSIVGNTTISGAIGISVSDSDYTTVSSNTMYGASNYGIKLESSSFCSLSGNTIEGADITIRGIETFKNSTNSIHNVISNNTINNTSGTSLYINNDSDYAVISGNSVRNPVGVALDVNYSDYVSITGNTIDGESTGTKAVVLDTCTKTAVSGNSFSNFTQDGVLLYATTTVVLDDIALTGNIFTATSTMINNQLSGGATLGDNITCYGNPGEDDYLSYGQNIYIKKNTGAPLGTYSAGIGSLYIRTTGGASTTLYVKESATDATGWVGK